MNAPRETVLAQFRFPLQEGDLAGCDVQMMFDAYRERVEAMVPAAEPCEGRCGADVGPSPALSGEAVDFALPGPLARMTLPRGLWEGAHDDVDSEGRTVLAVVFHSPERCRERRGPRPVRVAIDADCPGCGYPERSLDVETGVFGCSSLNPDQCDFTSRERNR